MYTTYTNASNNTPSYTHVSLYVLWKIHPLGQNHPSINMILKYNNIEPDAQ